MWFDQAILYQIYPWACAARRRTTTGIPSTASCGCWTGWSTSNSWGADTVLLNPVFDSDRHGYDTRDYNRLDPRLGTNEDLAQVCRAFHDAGLRVLLDGCSTMWAGASGPFGTYRRRSGTAPTGTGSI